MTTVPNLPVISTKVTPLEVKGALEQVRTFFNAMQKDGGFLTRQQMIDAEIIRIRGTKGSGLTSTVILGPAIDATIPPVVTGFEVNGAFNSIILAWDVPNYTNHSHTQVWRAAVDDLGLAVFVGHTGASVYQDTPPDSKLSVTYYYWVRNVNTSNIFGPFQASNGTPGKTADDPAYLLEILSGEITETQLYGALNERIDLVDDPETGLIRQWTAKINNKGFVSGFGLASEPVDGVPLSDFSVLADRFSVINPNVNQISVIQLTRDGNVVTATTATAHGFATGAYAVLTGAKQGEYNGTAKVTVLSLTVFTYIITTTPISPATGTIKVGSAGVPFIVTNNQVFINAAFIQDATITNAMIHDLSADKINAGFINAARIAAGTITTSMMSANTINANRLAAGTITTELMQAGTINANRLMVESITAGLIQAGAIVTETINGNAVTVAQSLYIDSMFKQVQFADKDTNIVTLCSFPFSASSEGTYYVVFSAGALYGESFNTEPELNYGPRPKISLWMDGVKVSKFDYVVPPLTLKQIGGVVTLSATADNFYMALTTTPPAGAHTFAVKITFDIGSVGAEWEFSYIQANAMNFYVINTKR